MDDRMNVALDKGGRSVSFRIHDGNGDVEFSGYVTWQGCLGWETSPDCMAYFRDPLAAQDFVRQLEEVWVSARKLMPDAEFEWEEIPDDVTDDRSADERDAISLALTLSRAARKWGPDARLQARAGRAEDWLRRYYQRNPHLVLRDAKNLLAHEPQDQAS